ncbi:MAG: NAD(P)-binding domain-containing protein [Candidatus Bathyarchaeia archaeon]
MAKEKVLVIGLGEVGRPLFELLKESGKFEVYGFDVDENKMRDTGQSFEALPETVDIMHVCIPCTSRENFTKTVMDYAERFKPKLIIVNSTVAPGTTVEVHRRLNKTCLVAHSPVRGVHKSLEHMKWELKRWTKYIGGVNQEAAQQAKKHFEEIGLKTKILKSSLETELAKLFETTYRAWMIVCFQEMHRVSRHFNADFSEIVDFIEDTHRVRLDRPVMFPGVIGGRCLIQNTELLLKSYDSKLLRFILESNEKRSLEIKDINIKREVEKIKKRVEQLEEELAKLVSIHGLGEN